MKYVQDANDKWSEEHSVISMGPWLHGFVEGTNLKKKQTPSLGMSDATKLIAEVI